MSIITQTIFVIVIVSEIILGGSLIFTLIYPHHRIWPPPQRNSWQFYFTWILTIIAMTGIFILGILDWNSFIYLHFSRFIIGGSLMIAGTVFLVWSIRTLSIHLTLGLEGELLTKGPYRYSRNPQYVGDIGLFIGFMLISNSILVSISVIIGIFWFILAPFTEEPWLRERFGATYEEYCQQVPRFIKFFCIPI